MSAFRRSSRARPRRDAMIAALAGLEAEVQRLKSLVLEVANLIDHRPVDAARAILAATTGEKPASHAAAAEPTKWSPLVPGMLYIHLYHGRKHPSENLDDWGSDGPIIGPLAYVHTTYLSDVKFAATPEVMDRFFPSIITDWCERGLFNACGPLCDWQFHVVDDMIEYGGLYYGDWRVFVADAEDGNLLPEPPLEQS